MADFNQQVLAKLDQIFGVVEATRRFGTTINNPVATVAAAISQPPENNTPGIVTRNIPSGTQPVSVNNFPPNLSNDNVIVVNTPNVSVVNFPPPVTSVAVNNFPPAVADQLIHGTVNVGNFPASVAVNNFPATQPVSVTNFPASVAINNFPPPVTSIAVNNFPVTQPISGTVAVSNFPAIQATREIKNTGRQQVCLTWENLAGTLAETLAAFTNGSRGGAAVASATSYTVSAGKTLHIQSLTFVFGQNGSSACNYRARIRQAAAVNATSPIIAAAGSGGPSNSSNTVSVPLPDGLEIPAGQQIGLTHIDTSTGGIFSAYLVGFEY